MRELIEQINSKFPNCVSNKIILSENKQKQIDSFLDENFFLKTNIYYIDFLKTYSGLSYFDDKTDEDFTLYGFNSNGIKFSDKEYFNEPLLDSKDYFLFGHLYMPNKNKFYDLVFNKNKEFDISLRENIEEHTNYILLCKSFNELLCLILKNEIK